jgi:SAM-dependent methyltransferase
MARPDAPDTRGAEYAGRLETLEGAAWKRWLDVQAPYRWNLRRLDLGFTLEVGCGIGRNLVHLDGVGVDHNPTSIDVARRRGCTAYTPEEFRASPDSRPARFDSLLAAHVLEHMCFDEARGLLGEYLPFVRAGGRVVLITPQEAGYRSDETHVEYLDFEALQRLMDASGLSVERSYSFPFPRLAGRVFPHNEFVVVGRVAA